MVLETCIAISLCLP